MIAHADSVRWNASANATTTAEPAAACSPITISGKVVGNGAVTVKVSYGDKSANGSGRLAGDIGAGSWSGGACAGTWEAERRG